jgi:hypothetical protein
VLTVRNAGEEMKHRLVQFGAFSFRKESVGDTADVEVGIKFTVLALEVECCFGSCWKTLLDSDDV